MLLRVKPPDFVGLAWPFLGSEKIYKVIQVEAGETGENLAAVLCARSGVLALPCLGAHPEASPATTSRLPPADVSVAASVCSTSFPDPSGSRSPYDNLRSSLLGSFPPREPQACCLGSLGSS